MKRQSINPADRGLQLSMGQGEIVEGVKGTLHFSGQVALVADADSEIGIRVVHADDIRAQLQDALNNIDATLDQAGFCRENIVTLRLFTTDVDGTLENYDDYPT